MTQANRPLPGHSKHSKSGGINRAEEFFYEILRPHLRGIGEGGIAPIQAVISYPASRITLHFSTLQLSEDFTELDTREIWFDDRYVVTVQQWYHVSKKDGRSASRDWHVTDYRVTNEGSKRPSTGRVFPGLLVECEYTRRLHAWKMNPGIKTLNTWQQLLIPPNVIPAMQYEWELLIERIVHKDYVFPYVFE